MSDRRFVSACKYRSGFAGRTLLHRHSHGWPSPARSASANRIDNHQNSSLLCSDQSIHIRRVEPLQRHIAVDPRASAQ
jgi:hypothetical protein